MFQLAENNIVWWRVDMPGRNPEGELDTAPVRLRLRIYTRAELRERQLERMRGSLHPLTDALDKLVNSADAEQLRAATTDVQARVDAFMQESDAADADVRGRLVGWRAEDMGGIEFDESWRDKLLDDEPRFNAIREALDEASRGVRAKNSLPGPAGKSAAAQAGTTNDSGTKTGNTPA